MDVTPIKVPQGLALVLNSAGDKSDVDFNYLVATAQRESSMNPTAKASSSSAVGLFQFLDSTWLQVMKQEGPRLGYQSYADAISVDKDGDYVIKDKKLRAEVLKLREDPQVAADMAAAFTRSNGEYLKGKFGRMPSPGELYIAHFLGPQGAEKMFSAGLDNPDQVAAALFPKQAKANPQIFYDHGHARTIREVYKALVAKHNDSVIAASPADTVVAAAAPDAVDPKFAAQQMATDSKGWATDELPSRFTKADMSFSSLFATVAGGASAGPLIGSEAEAPLIPVAQGAAVVPASGPAGSAAFAPVGAPEVPASVAAIDAAAPTQIAAADDAGPAGAESSQLGFVPFAAPAPLTAESMISSAPADPGTAPADVTPEVAVAQPIDLGMPQTDLPLSPATSNSGAPRARILMTPPDDAPGSSPFFTQLLVPSGS